MKNRALWFEFFGMSLIIIASLLEFTILGPLLSADNMQYSVESKLDSIFGVVSADYVNAPHNPQIMTSVWRNVDLDLKNWQYAGDGDKSISQQITIFGSVKFAIFLFGSVLLLLGKWTEIKSTTKEQRT